jgi:hypothetical protein
MSSRMVKCITDTSWGRSRSWRSGLCTDLPALAAQTPETLARLIPAALKMVICLGGNTLVVDQLFQSPVAVVAPARWYKLPEASRTRPSCKHKSTSRNFGPKPFPLHLGHLILWKTLTRVKGHSFHNPTECYLNMHLFTNFSAL